MRLDCFLKLQAETVAEGERRQQAELLKLRRDHAVLEEAHRRAVVNLAEVREKLAVSEINAIRLQGLSVKAAASDGGAVMQLHALKTRVAGRGLRVLLCMFGEKAY